MVQRVEGGLYTASSMTAPGENDPFAIRPSLWYAVLCHGAQFDRQKRITVQGVFNRWTMMRVPGREEPFVNAQAVLAIGYSYGVGEYSLAIDLRDVDGRVLWSAPRTWEFRLGPGEAAGATFVTNVTYFFTEPGRYYYCLTLSPGGQEDRVHFEVAPPPATTDQSPQSAQIPPE